MTLRVAILATYPTIQYGLRASAEIDPDIEVVGMAGSIDELVDLLALEPADVVLADVDWPDHEFEDLTGLPPVLLFVEDLATVANAVRAGTRGVLLRDTDSEALGSALHAVAHGLLVLDARAEVTGNIDARMDSTGLTYESLTPREIEVLQRIARGLPNKGIALELGISEHTVKFHVGSIMTKLGAASRAEALARAMSAGLVTV